MTIGDSNFGQTNKEMNQVKRKLMVFYYVKCFGADSKDTYKNLEVQ